MANSNRGRLNRAEEAAIAAENARLQLRLGRAAHGYGVIAAMVLSFMAILAYLMEVTDVFADPPFSSAVLLLWTLPMMVGIGVGSDGLAYKFYEDIFDNLGVSEVYIQHFMAEFQMSLNKAERLLVSLN